MLDRISEISDCKDLGIRELEFVAKTQFLCPNKTRLMKIKTTILITKTQNAKLDDLFLLTNLRSVYNDFNYMMKKYMYNIDITWDITKSDNVSILLHFSNTI